MPGYSFGISAKKCVTGAKLAKVKGSVCHGCYALKGFYMMPGVKKAHAKRLKAIKSKSWTQYMIAMITKKVKASEPYFRWHDSGDIQSVDHLAKIIEIVRATPQIHHWMPTREYKFVENYLESGGAIPDNLVIRLSAHMINGKVPDIKGLPVSSVSTSDSVYPDANQCPARHQDNACGDCRSCWDPKVNHVSYHKH